MSAEIRIVIADDHPIVRKGLRDVIEEEPDLKVTAEAGAVEVYLGRPWRPYSTVVFLNAELPAVVVNAGWSEWRPTETHSLETAFYAEYRSNGPGANPSARDPHAHQLSEADAEEFSADNFLRGQDQWKPQ